MKSLTIFFLLLFVLFTISNPVVNVGDGGTADPAPTPNPTRSSLLKGFSIKPKPNVKENPVKNLPKDEM